MPPPLPAEPGRVAPRGCPLRRELGGGVLSLLGPSWPDRSVTIRAGEPKHKLIHRDDDQNEDVKRMTMVEGNEELWLGRG